MTIPQELQATLDMRLLRLLKKSRRPCLAFSGGKDCLVLLHACRRLGYDVPWVSIRTVDFDWPQHLAYLDTFVGGVIQSTRHDFEWMKAHPQFLFPQESRVRNEWFRMVQRAGCQRYAARQGHDLLIWGRRDQENTVKADVYDLSGVVQAAPLRQWETLQVWDYLLAHRVAVSPLYKLPQASERGVHRWNTRKACEKEPDPWITVARFAPEVASRAATHFVGAANAIRSL